jgi:hypothetical protein
MLFDGMKMLLFLLLPLKELLIGLLITNLFINLVHWLFIVFNHYTNLFNPFVYFNDFEFMPIMFFLVLIGSFALVTKDGTTLAFRIQTDLSDETARMFATT